MQQALDALNTCNWDYDSEEESYKTFDEDLVNAAAAALKEALAKPEPIVSFTDNHEGLCIQLACDGSYYWQNLSDCDAAKFFVAAYRKKK